MLRNFIKFQYSSDSVLSTIKSKVVDNSTNASRKSMITMH